MKLTPLVLAGGVTIPRYTSRFSDALAVSSITVADGGLVTITTSAAHGVVVGQQTAISITDAEAPNPITAATVINSTTIEITTQYPHNQLVAPDGMTTLYPTVKLTGFTNAHLNGVRQIVSTPSPTKVRYMPGSAVTGPIGLTGNEKLLERMEDAIIGWHAVTAASSTTLTFPTPSVVERSYTVANPVVVRNIRIFGAVDLDAALSQFTRDDAALTKAHLFITPQPSGARASRSNFSNTDALGEIGVGSDYRQLLMDGFVALAFLPGKTTAAHVACYDLAVGEIFRAILRTYRGLKLPTSELACGESSYVALLDQHEPILVANRAIYVHAYRFQSTIELTQADAIAPFDWPSFDDAALADGTVPTTIPPTGAPVIDGLDFTGILRQGFPSPLTATFEIP